VSRVCVLNATTPSPACGRDRVSSQQVGKDGYYAGSFVARTIPALYFIEMIRGGSLGFRVVRVLDSPACRGMRRKEPEQVRDSDASSTQTPQDPA
jgi:hypothetical protein